MKTKIKQFLALLLSKLLNSSEINLAKAKAMGERAERQLEIAKKQLEDTEQKFEESVEQMREELNQKNLAFGKAIEDRNSIKALKGTLFVEPK